MSETEVICGTVLVALLVIGTVLVKIFGKKSKTDENGEDII